MRLQRAIRCCWPALRDERGGGPATAALLIPSLLACVFLAITASFYAHARDVVTSAAAIASQAASQRGAAAADGQAAAQEFLAAAGTGRLVDYQVTVSEGDTVVATVTGTASPLLGQFTLPGLRAQSHSAKEQVSIP